MTSPRQDAPYSGPIDRLDAPGRAAALDRSRALARLLDNLIRIPGTNIGIGLDSIIGLVPGLGDVAGGVMSAYVLLTAARLGVPKAVLGRMLLNLGTDALVGAVPVLGDLFDVGFKANQRNVRLLEQSLGAPAETRRTSGWIVAGAVLGAVAIAAAGVGLTILLLKAVWGAVGS
jgi:hypothetical protein